MAKEKKLQPNLPLGFTDRSGKELSIKDKLIGIIKQNFERFGFSQLETPSFEISENIGKFLPDEGRPMSGVFGFQEENNNWMSLRYDLTAPLARYVSKNSNEISNPFKRYQVGTVWRNEKPGPGRFREFTQIDADIVGSKNNLADAEMCSLISDTLIKCGLEKKDFKINLSNRKLIQGLINQLKINDDEQKLIVIRAIDKLDRIGVNGVEQLLKKGRKDQSGDFTKGANLSDSQTSEIINFLNLKNISEVKNILTNQLAVEGIDELQKILEGVKYGGYESQLNFNPTVVRGLEYYTGAIFEANLTFKVKNLKGKEVEFGSIGGGGRYDNLVSRFNKIDLPATGISLGLDRLIFALTQLEKVDYQNKEPIIICILDNKYLPKYYEILKELRDKNINSEIYLGDASLKSQLKYADKRNSPAVVLCGDNEFKENKITIKNLKKGKIESEKLQSREDWKQGENIQVTFPKENLINEIKKII